MKLIKDNKQYNPHSVSLLLSLIVSLIFTLIVVTISSKITSRLINQSRQEFDEYCEDMSSGYAQSVKLILENYFFGLETFVKEKHIAGLSDREIQKLIIDAKDLNHPDFMNVSFVNLDGMLYTQKSTSNPVTDRDYYRAIAIDGQDQYVSSPVISNLNGEQIIIIAKAFKDESGRLRGFFTASIRLSTFNEKVSKLLLNKDIWIFIQGPHGKFICHPDKEVLLKTYVPDHPDYRQFTSEWVSSIEKGHFKTISTKGIPVTIFVQKILSTNWTLGISIPDKFFSAFKEQEIRYRFIIVFIGFVTMFILTFIELYVIKLLHRHQHIETIYDSLTNLWTRKHFETEAAKILKHNPNSKFMFLECDIRRFRFTYQNYGEDASDAMIFYFSRRLNKIAMKYNAIIGRGFADHFYILIKITSVRKAMSLFKKEMNALNLKTKDYEIPFMGKYGISFLMPENTDRADTIQQLIGQASFAKTTIQENLLTQYAIYNSKLLNKIREERFIEGHMEEALKKGEFYVMYQPKISLVNDKVVGAEALVRWQSPSLGKVMPDTFIPLFEKNGFITKLDFYVYEEVFKFLEKQIADGNALVPVSVNMSRNHSKPDKFMHDFLSVFKRYSIPTNMIQVEIIERSVMDDETLKDITEKLHKAGFTVAMDDFGSGESSLNMLTKIPIDVLKFDRSFLQSSTKSDGRIDKASADFIEILIEMSKVLNKSTVFEGVETEIQRDFLRSIKCDEAQGFFYSKPLMPQDFIEFIKIHS